MFVIPGTSQCFADDRDPVLQGKQIYGYGTTLGGQAIKAVVQNDVPLPPAAAACANCHRRSGLGVAEGGSRSLNLSAPSLFNATSKPPLRPAYDEQTLVRAIVAGVAADGRLLDETMPRYELGNDDAFALVAYLKTLGATAPVGVTASTLTIATIIADSAPQDQKEAVLRVMQTFVDVKNGESRNETKRAAAASRHFYGRTAQRAYRAWKLLTWYLHGDSSTWGRQLAEYARADEPFAILSGTAGPEWQAIHEFCEASEIPCILPLAAGVENADDFFYSLYFSTGPVLEARVAASHVSRLPESTNRKVLVVLRDDKPSQAALEAFRKVLAASSGLQVIAKIVKGRQALSARKWRSILRSAQADVLLIMLGAESINALASIDNNTDLVPDQLYTMESYSAWPEEIQNIDGLLGSINHVYPYTLPSTSATQFPREYLWLQHHGLGDLDPVAASRTLYACRVMGVGLADVQTNFSREYFLEALEHALDGTQLTSVYPHTSLGPSQRLLSRGAYVVSLSQLSRGQFSRAEWIQP